MKTIRYFFFVALATVLMAADCSNKDSEFYNDVFVSVPDLVKIVTSDVPEDQSVRVTAEIPKLLTVAGMARPLDIYQTTGGAAKLNFSYELEKETTPGQWDYVEIVPNQVNTTIGESEAGSFVLGKAVYNAVSQVYEYDAHFQNLTAGKYRLSFGYNSIAGKIVELRSESINNNLFLNLNSENTTDLNASGYFEFNVN